MWINKDYLVGFEEGVYKPYEELTRAQFISFINRLFDYENMKEHQFEDVNEGSWYEEEVKKSIANGYIVGFSDNTFRPNSIITRIEAAAVLSRLVDLEENLDAIKNFDDYGDIPAWGINSVSAVIDAGLMSEFLDQTFGANKEITRAQAILALQKAKDLLIKDEVNDLIIDEAGVYGPLEGDKTYTNIYIQSPDVTLQNVIVLEDLVIGEEVGDGDVTLNNVNVVNGALIIKGGGTDSIKINGGKYNSIRIESTPTGGVRVVATGVVDKDGNIVDIIISENIDGRKVILEGDFDEVIVQSVNVSIETLRNTNINKITVKEESRFVKITTSNDTNINSLDNQSKSLVRVRGDGNVGSDAGRVTYGEPSTPTKTTPREVLVEDISITASSITIDEDGDTLQMIAEVLPANADNKEVTWSIRTNQDDGNETGYALISEEGVLRAITNGTVTVIATANDGSNVSGELVINMSNQHVILEPNIDITTGSAIFTYSFTDRGLDVDYGTALDVYGLNTTASSIALLKGDDINKPDLDTESILFSDLGLEYPEGTVSYENIEELNNAFNDDFSKWGDGPDIARLYIEGEVVEEDWNMFWSQYVHVNLTAEDKNALTSLIDQDLPDQVLINSINLTSSAIEVELNETLQINANVEPNDADNKTLSWSIDNTNGGDAEIDQEGLLTATSSGGITVIAQANDESGVKGGLDITVVDPQPQVNIEPRVSITTGSAIFTYEFYDESIDNSVNYEQAITNYGLDPNLSTVELRIGESYTDPITMGALGITTNKSGSTVTYGSYEEVSTAFGDVNFFELGGVPDAIRFNMYGEVDGNEWNIQDEYSFEDSDKDAFISVVEQITSIEVRNLPDVGYYSLTSGGPYYNTIDIKLNPGTITYPYISIDQQSEDGGFVVVSNITEINEDNIIEITLSGSSSTEGNVELYIASQDGSNITLSVTIKVTEQPTMPPLI
jgi:uncharacterized protein YjdB